MPGFPDWQNIVQWQGAPLFAGNFAVTGVLQTLINAAALGNYKGLLCYCSPGGGSAVQIFYNYSLADTGAGVVTFTRSVVCPPGQSVVFTVPNLTNQVQVRCNSNAPVSADIAAWPTNQINGYGLGSFPMGLWSRYAVNVAAGATVSIDLPVFAGLAKLFGQTSAAGMNWVIENNTVAAVPQARVYQNLGSPAVFFADIALALGWNQLQIGNPSGAPVAFTGSLVPWEPV